MCGARATGPARGFPWYRLLIGASVAVVILAAAALGYAAFRPRTSGAASFERLLESGNRHMQRGAELAEKSDREGALREWRQAIRDFEAAVRVVPTDLHARSDLGLVYMYTGQGDKAQQTLKAVLQEDPNYLWAIFNLAWVYRTVGEDLKALELYQHYLNVVGTERQKKDKYAAHYDLIEVQVERARAEVQELLGQQPDAGKAGREADEGKAREGK